MKFRKITSLTALLSFVVLIITSVILYIVPPGRVAYWADWHLLCLSKTQWGDIHINTGILFLVSIFLHIYYNWKAIVSYLKDRSKQLKIVTQEFNIALLITTIFCIGTYFEIPPFSTVLQISEFIKDSGAEKYGEPPYGHAELSSLKLFSTRMGLDLNQCMKNLKNDGIEVENPKHTILEIARQNRLSPKQIYLRMKPADFVKIVRMPDSPEPGFGRKTISEICKKYDLDINVILRKLADKNIKATADMTFKEIAMQSNSNPMDVFILVRNAETNG